MERKESQFKGLLVFSIFTVLGSGFRIFPSWFSVIRGVFLRIFHSWGCCFSMFLLFVVVFSVFLRVDAFSFLYLVVIVVSVSVVPVMVV